MPARQLRGATTQRRLGSAQADAPAQPRRPGPAASQADAPAQQRRRSAASQAGAAALQPVVVAPVVSPVGDRFRYLDHYVYDALLEAIVQGRLVPGTRLVLDDLAEQLKVSRTPIRDALARLTSEGLVRRLGRKGFTLTTLSPAELSDLYDVRLMCELYAVESGIANATPDLLDEMADRANQGFRSLRSANPLAASLKDREFHRLLVSLGRNPKLETVFEQLNIHIQTLRVRPGQENLEEQRQHYHLEHLAIVDAIRAGNLAEAKDAIRRHIEAAAARAVAALEVTPPTPPLPA